MKRSLSSVSRPALCVLVGVTLGVVAAVYAGTLWAIPITIGFVTIVEAGVEAITDLVGIYREGVES